MKKYLLLGLIVSSLYSKSDFIDFGIDGHMYDIKEENIRQTIIDKVDNFKISKEDLTEKIKKAMREQSVGTTNLPFGEEVTAYVEDNYQILNQNIRNPAGRIIKKKGDRVLLNTPKSLDICFIDGSNDILLKNQIKYFDAVVSKKHGLSCVYMVSNKSVLDLNKEYYPRLFYPSKSAYERRFMIKSIPTYIHIEKDKKYFYSFPIEMFKKEVKIK